MDGIEASSLSRSLGLQPIAWIELDGIRLFNDIEPHRLEALRLFWSRHGYLHIQNALTNDAIALLDTQISFDVMHCVDDPIQFHRAHNDAGCNPFIRKFLDVATDYYAAVLAVELAPAYGFAMKYLKNSDMEPHYDNLNNPISSTVCYRFTPEGERNPIYVDRARFENPHTHRLTVMDRSGIPRENVVAMHLKPGDLAVFRGRNHLHWRDFISSDIDYRAILLHYSDYKYKGRLIPPQPDMLPSIEAKLIDLESYDRFRERYAMYFKPTGDWV